MPQIAKLAFDDLGLLCTLAAAAVVVAVTATAAVVGAHQRIVATAAEQNQQDDDPAQIATAEAIVTHKNTSEYGLERSRSFQDIPWLEKGAKKKARSALRTLPFYR